MYEPNKPPIYSPHINLFLGYKTIIYSPLALLGLRLISHGGTENTEEVSMLTGLTGITG
jgi:hypothetical protein